MIVLRAYTENDKRGFASESEWSQEEDSCQETSDLAENIWARSGMPFTLF